MKRLLLIGLAVALLAVGVVRGEAQYEPRAISDPNTPQISTVLVRGAEGGTNAPNINNNDLIIGFTVTDPDAGWAALFDADAASEMNDTNTIAEASVVADSATTIVLPAPSKIDNGGVRVSSDTGSLVTIYYVARE